MNNIIPLSPELANHESIAEEEQPEITAEEVKELESLAQKEEVEPQPEEDMDHVVLDHTMGGLRKEAQEESSSIEKKYVNPFKKRTS